jgi:hypothetical protein
MDITRGISRACQAWSGRAGFVFTMRGDQIMQGADARVEMISGVVDW